MNLAKRIIDFVILLLLAAWISLFLINQFGSITRLPIGESRTFELASALIPAMIGSLASISGILIAVYLLSTQLSGRKPYSRLVKTFYDTSDLLYFLLFFASLLILSFTFTLIANSTLARQHALLASSIAIYCASLLAVTSLMVKHFGIFSPRQVAIKALRAFNASSVTRYGLVRVETNNHDSHIVYELKTWGHRHNLEDPLGPFHDILIEAIEARERTTFHLYLSVFTEKIAALNGVTFHRRFGLATGEENTEGSIHKPSILQFIRIQRPLETKIQITIHALHYMVRRARKMTAEWALDNHRQIFVINISDLIIALATSRSNGPLIELCLHAILSICIGYKDVPPHGSYEPLKDLFTLAQELKEAFPKECNTSLKILAFLDLNTTILSRNTDFELDSLPSETISYFFEQRRKLEGTVLHDAFPKSLWNSL